MLPTSISMCMFSNTLQSRVPLSEARICPLHNVSVVFSMVFQTVCATKHSNSARSKIGNCRPTILGPKIPISMSSKSLSSLKLSPPSVRSFTTRSVLLKMALMDCKSLFQQLQDQTLRSSPLFHLLRLFRPPSHSLHLHRLRLHHPTPLLLNSASNFLNLPCFSKPISKTVVQRSLPHRLQPLRLRWVSLSAQSIDLSNVCGVTLWITVVIVVRSSQGRFKKG